MEHWLETQARIAPNKIAVETDTRVLTFKALYDQAVKLGAQFNQLERSRIGLYVNNSIEAIICIHAAWLYGIEIVMINHRLTRHEIEKQLNSIKVRDVITTLPLELASEFHIMNYTALCSHSTTNARRQPLNMERIASIMFTSGTTGPQKAVPQTFKNHQASAQACYETLGFSDESRWLTVLPIYHISGLSIIIRSVLYGFTVYLKEKFDDGAILACIQHKHITHLSLVPQTLIRLMQSGLKKPYTLKRILLGGAKLDSTLITKALEYQLPIYNSFGMTETCSQFLTASPAMLNQRPNTVGCVSAQQCIKIKDVNSDGHGVLFVKGDNVMNGYLYPESINASMFDEEGYFNTGDIASIDGDYVTIYDRRKDLIISGGENVYPFEIESKAKSLKGVKDAMCVGTPDDKWGAVPVLYIVSELGETVIPILENYLKEQLAKFKLPKAIYIVEMLPYTSTGKLQRQHLVEVEK
ncbi:MULTISPECIES: o-succinylbenzoate--CoA ligase [Staphylococcus]|uniref:o-succinylbenzoate--CoA ligase n=1 Tax=Staphylococcus TaxID=1279 RepID=UPI000CCFEDE1|nr:MULTISPECIES: o-succinylbenzoate--CoA ligase [Staphylococcus]MBY7665099.1 o-succinylbenzoate--CoA ligase [Staphylococcus agnetis]NHM75437.1 o-succinylbenzoate--CoA ligase [Staphylococcus sp. 11007852]NJH68454.1 o-succinylbenzoate--CoA ligase [Staphylococcus agnetis]NJH80213.1 o-succinylbenzoate--CoA ligase [Staphylococcus agnetis]NJH83319.1 o-succinylbenzoate--CoA ligase [Staphylococcus agnetis]